MSFQNPLVVVIAVLACLALLAGYGWLQGERTRTLAAAGLTTAGSRGSRVRRHLPPMLFLAALTLLLIAVARPQATVAVPRAAGTVVLAFDISNSMAADDVAPTRLDAAKAAAVAFVEAQPDTVDVGIVAFGDGAQTTQLPTNDQATVVAAINRLTVAGGTSLGQAILGSMTVITGQPASLPTDDMPPADLGFWPSATIVLFSDGEDTGGPDAVAAAELAAMAGIHIETVGVGTVAGTTVEVDGYQMSTALNEELLTTVAGSTAGGYHRADNTQTLESIHQSLDLRITTQDEFLELTGVVAGIAALLLLIGGLLMINWFGRIL